jgi:hypothetical protein
MIRKSGSKTEGCAFYHPEWSEPPSAIEGPQPVCTGSERSLHSARKLALVGMTVRDERLASAGMTARDEQLASVGMTARDEQFASVGMTEGYSGLGTASDLCRRSALRSVSEREVKVGDGTRA